MIELDYAHDGAVALLTLKRPPANAFTPEGLLQLQQTVERLNVEARVRAIVITGDGPRFFSAGADLNTFADGDREVARTAAARFGAAFETLQNARPVVIAAITATRWAADSNARWRAISASRNSTRCWRCPRRRSACCPAVAAHRHCLGWSAKAGPSG